MHLLALLFASSLTSNRFSRTTLASSLELNMLKTQLLVKGISTHDTYSAAKGFLENDARLASIKDTITLASFTAEGYVGLGFPLGTDAFVQKFVHDACQKVKVIDDVDKLDHIEDDFVHYQLPYDSVRQLVSNT